MCHAHDSPKSVPVITIFVIPLFVLVFCLHNYIYICVKTTSQYVSMLKLPSDQQRETEKASPQR